MNSITIVWLACRVVESLEQRGVDTSFDEEHAELRRWLEEQQEAAFAAAWAARASFPDEAEWEESAARAAFHHWFDEGEVPSEIRM